MTTNARNIKLPPFFEATVTNILPKEPIFVIMVFDTDFKKITLLFVVGLVLSTASAQIRVSDSKKILTTKDGAPFFWLGDTDWELFHRLTREETEEFLEIRKQQGFTGSQYALQRALCHNRRKTFTST